MKITFSNHKNITMAMSETEFLQLAAEIEDIQTNYPQSVAIGKRFALFAQQIDKEWCSTHKTVD